jgi:hypothetical protein
MRPLLVLAFVLFASCNGAPVIYDQPVIPTSDHIAGVGKMVGEARCEVQTAGISIKADVKPLTVAENATVAATAKRIDKAADAVLAGAGKIQAQEAVLAVVGKQAVVDEAGSKAKDEKIVDLTKERDHEKSMASTYRLITLIAILLGAVGCGIGFWLKNLRLSVAAPLVGGVAAVLVALSRAADRWSGWLLAGVAVLVAVTGVCLLVEWWKNRSLANTLRETEKPAKPLVDLITIPLNEWNADAKSPLVPCAGPGGSAS